MKFCGFQRKRNNRGAVKVIIKPYSDQNVRSQARSDVRRRIAILKKEHALGLNDGLRHGAEWHGWIFSNPRPTLTLNSVCKQP
jgi:hypothetical protein